MASKGPKSKFDSETRSKRHKALEASKEPRRPKTHWDHVLEEMVWLSKDFESERKWKLAQAKRVAIRASKCNVDQATKGEKKMKEEEQRLRKVAINISKEMKKFWTKIEKLVLYKHQLELEERKKKALDKQLDFLLGQTERYSTMLAENLVDMHHSDNSMPRDSRTRQTCGLDAEKVEVAKHSIESQSDSAEIDDNYGVESEDESEDDEHTLEEDEALITEEERREELAALKNEVDLPLEELLQHYMGGKVSREATPGDVDGSILKDKDQIKDAGHHINGSAFVNQSSNGASVLLDEEDNGTISEADKPTILAFGSGHHHKDIEESLSSEGLKRLQPRPQSKSLPNRDCLPPVSCDEMEDDADYMLIAEEEKDDDTTLSEEEVLAMKEANNPLDELKLLQQESEIPIEELLARYKKEELSYDGSEAKSECDSSSSDDQLDCLENKDTQQRSPCGSLCGDESEQQKTVEIDNHIATTEITVGKDIESDEGKESENIIADAAAAARSAQPTGNTFSTTKVRTKFPFLLKHPLREYQHIGLDWLVTMYEKRLNGILADEMGLGKTIMTISLLAHLACEKGIWGPHLIVVPTSVMLNWETEFLKWCPAFKILTYFGSAKERKQKRQGWLKPNYFHVCITTYRLVIQDSKVFKRKKWKYLILDEAHLIKNWKSQRWQTLLNFNSKRRILLTGTPLQNDLMELWSLMHFLMPHIFQSHQEFKDWFSNPITGMVEGQEKVNKDVVDRLHNVLRPFILRRLKRDVEKQLPKKHEHVIHCRLSKRQRNLYEDFIASSETQATLASSNFFGMISVIMQLRKVCNHPDLFEGRPIISSFDMPGIDMQLSSSICTINSADPFSYVDLKGLNFVFTQLEFSMTSWEVDEVAVISVASSFFGADDLEKDVTMGSCSRAYDQRRIHGTNIFEDIHKAILEERVRARKERAATVAWWNSLQCQKKPVYGTNLRVLVSIKHPVFDIHEKKANPLCYMNFSSKLADAVLPPVERLQAVLDLVECFMFAIPAARVPSPVCWCSKADPPVFLNSSYKEAYTKVFSPLLLPIRPAIVRRQVYFPDRRLIQFDCGKLQELEVLLRRLKSEGHRALIFTQMTKMLDILEAFINLYGYTYMRLDGSTQPEERQTLMQRFNTNPKYFLFILSTRSGGVGINLVGADTVIFYDSDWNPAMDQQAQDRCHRIGQTREVHIYRLISESTIEENILKKANQKRALDDLVIQSGSYNTEFFKKLDPAELFSGHQTLKIENLNKESSAAAEGLNVGNNTFSNDDVEAALQQAEDEADYMALKRVEQEEAVENQEFTEETMGRLEDDELINDDEAKLDDITMEEQGFSSSIVPKDTTLECALNEDKPFDLVEREDDIDMLADVKQMAAAAAAAGEASSSFENKLRPIDRYAMRFLDLWDPIIDKSEIEHVVSVEEEEWELDRIQKFKDDLEAEIDEDEEPLLYESWDAEIATKAYKEHVEALAQRQLLEDLEYEANERIDVDDGSGEATRDEHVVRKRKPKKKSKKTKFKSLRKGSLASDMEVMHEESEFSFETIDGNALSPEVISENSPVHLRLKKKRRLSGPEEEKFSRKGLKKLKRAPESNLAVDSDSSDKLLSEAKDLRSVEGITDVEIKPASRSKMGGKISITFMPVKRVMVVKPEKLKKRGNIWSKDCVPSPDSWSSQEDAILCAVVHEYGTHWSLVSDVLYSMPAGGFYRGRYRHPVHCCERFRELYFRYINCTADGNNTEKTSAYGSGKALLKVTEDHLEALLNVASELPDTELLLQKHFTAVLSSVWRVKCNSFHSVSASRDGGQSGRKFYSISGNKARRPMHPAILRQSSQVVAAVLRDVNRADREKPSVVCSETEMVPEAEPVKMSLEFPKDLVESAISFPSSVTILVHNPDASRPAREPPEQSPFLRSFRTKAEHRFRLASEACLEGEVLGWASSAFPTCDVARLRSGTKSQTLGKHKSLTESNKLPKSKVPRVTETDDSPSAIRHLMPLLTPIFSDSIKSNEASFVLDTSDDDSYHIPLIDVLPPELSNLESLVYEDDLSFIAGLKDWQSFDDVVDVG